LAAGSAESHSLASIAPFPRRTEGNGYVSFYADGAWHNFPYRAFNLAVRGDEVWFTTYPDYVTYRFDGAGMKPYSTVCGPFTSVPVIAAPGDIWFSTPGGMCHLTD
jgi:hypothetical protein